MSVIFFAPLKLTRIIVALSGLCIFAGLGPMPPRSGLSQSSQSVSRPNFAGKWVADNSKSDGAIVDLAFVIVHKDPELKITFRSKPNGKESSEVTYYTDGRGDSNSTQLITNPVLAGKEPIRSKTKWDGQKLVTKFSEEIHLSKAERDAMGARLSFGRKYYDWTVTWQLSKNGLLSKTVSYNITGADRVSRPIAFRNTGDFNRIVLRRAQ